MPTIILDEKTHKEFLNTIEKIELENMQLKDEIKDLKRQIRDLIKDNLNNYIPIAVHNAWRHIAIKQRDELELTKPEFEIKSTLDIHCNGCINDFMECEQNGFCERDGITFPEIESKIKFYKVTSTNGYVKECLISAESLENAYNIFRLHFTDMVPDNKVNKDAIYTFKEITFENEGVQFFSMNIGEKE